MAADSGRDSLASEYWWTLDTLAALLCTTFAQYLLPTDSRAAGLADKRRVCHSTWRQDKTYSDQTQNQKLTFYFFLFLFLLDQDPCQLVRLPLNWILRYDILLARRKRGVEWVVSHPRDYNLPSRTHSPSHYTHSQADCNCAVYTAGLTSRFSVKNGYACKHGPTSQSLFLHHLWS